MGTHGRLVYAQDLVEVLVYRQQKGIPLRQLVAVLVLHIQQRPLVLPKALLKLEHLRLVASHVALGALQAAHHCIELLRDIQPCLRLCRELRRELAVLRVQLVRLRTALARLPLALIELATCAREFVLKALQIALESIGLELEREARGRVRLAEAPALCLELGECALHGGEIRLALREQALCAREVRERTLQGRLLGFERALLLPQGGVVRLVRGVEVGRDLLPCGALALELADEVLDVRGELFLALAVGVDVLGEGFVVLDALLELVLQISDFLYMSLVRFGEATIERKNEPPSMLSELPLVSPALQPPRPSRARSHL